MEVRLGIATSAYRQSRCIDTSGATLCNDRRGRPCSRIHILICRRLFLLYSWRVPEATGLDMDTKGSFFMSSAVRNGAVRAEKYDHNALILILDICKALLGLTEHVSFQFEACRVMRCCSNRVCFHRSNTISFVLGRNERQRSQV